MNCGMTVANIAPAFGFNRLFRTPWSKALRAVMRAGGAGTDSGAPAGVVRNGPAMGRRPRKTRNAAPASLKTVNATSELSSKAATPTTDAAAHAALPTPTPTAEREADLAPARKALRMISAVSGPGVTMRTAATAIHAA